MEYKSKNRNKLLFRTKDDYCANSFQRLKTFEFSWHIFIKIDNLTLKSTEKYLNDSFIHKIYS